MYCALKEMLDLDMVNINCNKFGFLALTGLTWKALRGMTGQP